MCNVWKVGSRWDDVGSKNQSIISIFRRNNIVFVGKNTKSFEKNVKKGDYIAIADGLSICSVAKVISDPVLINKLQIKITTAEKAIFDYNECKDFSCGVRVKIVDLKEGDFLKSSRGAFFKIRKIETKNKVIKLYNDGKKFYIRALTYTIKGDKSGFIPLLNNVKYVIPIFQRPYSWSEDQLEPFVDDIFKGYWGFEKQIEKQEAMFIGTMQLSEKKFISKNEYEQEVIDGQQRISTIIVLLKVLQLKYPDNDKLSTLNFIWLETRVNNGSQDDFLNCFLNLKGLDELDNTQNLQNNYIIAAKAVSEYFDNNIEVEAHFEIEKFITYIYTQIYFVAIETYAGISKTIQIFNTINTTGLDLNGGDLFKVRMYEYLRDKDEHDESIFDEINELYKLIDDKNIAYANNVTNIIDVLGIYRDYIIAKYDLPNVLFDYNTETFFERLFDTILGINNWEHFSKASNEDTKLELSLAEIKKCIETRFKWHSNKFISVENMFSYELLFRSRYSKYWRMVYQILYINFDNPNVAQMLSESLILINKIAFIYSVSFDKSIIKTRSFFQNSIKNIVRNGYNKFSCDLREQLKTYNKNDAKNELSGYIAYNAKKKNLICQMLSYLDEVKINTDIKRIKQLLFETAFDIEHIHANADNSVVVEDDLQNSIGNLSMLEAKINRSISDSNFDAKKMAYNNSNYSSIKSLVKFTKWEQKEIVERRDLKVQEIMEYLFESHHLNE